MQGQPDPGFLGHRDEAWEGWCRSLRVLSIHDFDDRLAVTLGTAGRTEWIAGRAETEKNGQIVASITNTILQPTSFSSVK